MADTLHFSDRELGPKPREEQDITPKAWGGIVAITHSLISTGALAIDFPKYGCDDGSAWITGTDQSAFSLAAQGHIPDLEWPLQTVKSDEDPFGPANCGPYAPQKEVILDFVEFCHRHVAQPIRQLHSYWGHYHFDFDREAGQESYRSDINRIFARNGVVYELRLDGAVERLAPPALRESLRSAVFRTGDATLDDLLEDSRTKFLNRDVKIRRESLEKLWDAWERLKTLDNPANKKLSITALLDKVSSEPTLRATVEAEAKELTRIGNDFQIRHTEVGKPLITDSGHVDYLFHRMFAFVLLLLEKR